MKIGKKQKTWIIWAGVVVVLVSVLALLMRPTAVSVVAAAVARGSLSVTVEEQGRTRARHRYTVASPITGRLMRTTIHVGQRVLQGDALVRIAPPPEDPRAEATARADLAAALAHHRETEAQLSEMRGSSDRARSEMVRRMELYNKQLISIESRDQYVQSFEAAKSRLASAQASMAAAQAQVDSARSRLLGTDGTQTDANTIVVRAPVSGQVLRIHEESERVIQAGTTLFELSADNSLELVIDVLTQDAFSIEPGDAIKVTGYGASDTLKGIVRYVEPQAFTKVSTLGVEEQRVNVIGELIDKPADLGADYRIDAAIVTWSSDDVLLIPTSALFRRDARWYSFVIVAGKAQLREVTIGQRNAQLAELLSGVAEGESVILYPSDLIVDGVVVDSGSSS